MPSKQQEGKTANSSMDAISSDLEILSSLATRPSPLLTTSNETYSTVLALDAKVEQQHSTMEKAFEAETEEVDEKFEDEEFEDEEYEDEEFEDEEYEDEEFEEYKKGAEERIRAMEKNETAAPRDAQAPRRRGRAAEARCGAPRR